MDEAALEEKLKALIFADEDLYMRILRYEPIEFDVFVRLLKDVKMGKLKMRAAVRGILDKLVSRIMIDHLLDLRFVGELTVCMIGQAINFYAADGTVGRSRTKKK